MTSIFNSVLKEFESIAASQKKQAGNFQGQFRLRKSIFLGETFLLHTLVHSVDDEEDLANISSLTNVDMLKTKMKNKYHVPWQVILQIVGLFSEKYLKEADAIRPFMREIKIVNEVTSLPKEEQSWECVLQGLDEPESLEIEGVNRSVVDSTANSVSEIKPLTEFLSQMNAEISKLNNPQGELQDFLQNKGWKMYQTEEKRTLEDKFEGECWFTIELAGKTHQITGKSIGSSKKEAKTGAVREALAFMYLNFPETWKIREERLWEKENKQLKEVNTRAYSEKIKSFKSELNTYIQREPKVFFLKPVEYIISKDAHQPLWRVTVEIAVTIPKREKVLIEKTIIDKSKKDAEEQAFKQVFNQIFFRFREAILQNAILAHIKFD